MFFSSCRFIHICLIGILSIVLPVSSYQWSFKALIVETKTKNRAEPYFASLTWIRDKVTSTCDKNLMNSHSLHDLPLRLKSKSINVKTVNVESSSVDPGTLYEYIMILNPPKVEDKDKVLFDIQSSKPQPSEKLNSFLADQYTLQALLDRIINKTSPLFCKDTLFHDSPLAKSINHCIFMQIEESNNGNLHHPVKTLATEQRQIIKYLQPYHQPRHSYYSEAFKFIFSQRGSKGYLENTCFILMRIAEKKSSRLIVCHFDSSAGEKFQKIHDETNYFCGEHDVDSKYKQYFNQVDNSIQDEVQEFYTLINNDNFTFNNECYSTVTVTPDDKTIDNRYVQMNLLIKTKLHDEPESHLVLNNNHDTNKFDEALRDSLSKHCPYETDDLKKPQNFHFHMKLETKIYLPQLVIESNTLPKLRRFKPCFFQFDVGEVKGFEYCIQYLPLIDKNSITGGFQLANELVISAEKNNCRVSLTKAHEKCTTNILNQYHLALVCQCVYQYCDEPNLTPVTTLLSNIRPKVCASRLTPSEEDYAPVKNSIYYVACYYQITELDGRPQFTFGVYDLEMADNEGLPLINCLNSKLSNKQRCTTKNERQLCCCKAEVDNPCNTVDVARNQHSTSKLSVSAACGTYLHLNPEDKAACTKKSSSMRICISVYEIVKTEILALRLKRETCESEHLDSPFDLALTKCHAYRKRIVNEKSGKCAIFLVEESRQMTAEEASHKVINCCPPEAYIVTRDKLKYFKFKSIAEFV